MVQHRKIIVMHHINIMKGRSYMIILIDAERAFDKIQYLSWFKKKRNLKLEAEGYFLNLRAICEKPIANILLNGERQSLFPKIRNETEMPPFVTSVQQRLPKWLHDKESVCQAGDVGSIAGSNPWVGKIPWRRKWWPTPVFLPEESQGQQSLVGCCLWGRRELEKSTEVDWSDLAAAVFS